MILLADGWSHYIICYERRIEQMDAELSIVEDRGNGPATMINLFRVKTGGMYKGKTVNKEITGGIFTNNGTVEEISAAPKETTSDLQQNVREYIQDLKDKLEGKREGFRAELRLNDKENMLLQRRTLGIIISVEEFMYYAIKRMERENR